MSLEYLFVRFKIETSGATAVEYALLAGGVALAVIAGAALMGSAVENVFNEASAGL